MKTHAETLEFCLMKTEEQLKDTNRKLGETKNEIRIENLVTMRSDLEDHIENLQWLLEDEEGK